MEGFGSQGLPVLGSYMVVAPAVSLTSGWKGRVRVKVKSKKGMMERED